MNLKGKKVGFCFTGSFCTFSTVMEYLKKLVEEGAEVLPIMSFHAYQLDTKFGKAQDFIQKIEEITKQNIIHTIQGAEPIGPKKLTDVMVVLPCSGNTIGKLANGIIDNPVTMAVNAHLT